MRGARCEGAARAIEAAASIGADAAKIEQAGLDAAMMGSYMSSRVRA